MQQKIVGHFKSLMRKEKKQPFYPTPEGKPMKNYNYENAEYGRRILPY